MYTEFMQKALALLLIVIAIIFFLFSYLWVDLAIVLMLGASHSIINNIYPALAYGEGNRQFHALVYLLLLTLMFIAQLIIFKKSNILSPKLFFITAFITTVIFSISYPLFSHDIFTYLFFSKVVVTYQMNPYQVTPNDFRLTDLWVGFVHSVDGNYRYGIVYLIYTLIPMFILSGSKFILNFFALKFMNALLFFITGVVLYKYFDHDKKVFSLWFFNPLLIIELLINSHNDLLMITLFIFSVVLLKYKKNLYSVGFIIASAATKYISLYAAPMLVLNEKWRDIFFKITSIVLIAYLVTTTTAVHSWYYCWLFMFVPFMKLSRASYYLIFISGFLLMVNYSSFVKTREWGNSLIIPDIRLIIIIVSLLIVIAELYFNNKLQYLKNITKLPIRFGKALK